jgi:transcriptional regulator with XRE-family HTH domain
VISDADPTGIPPRRLGVILREHRNRWGGTIAAAAKATSIDADRISLVERGRASVTQDEVFRLAEAYGVDRRQVIPERKPPQLDDDTGRTTDEMLRRYLDEVLKARRKDKPEHLLFRQDDLRWLVSVLGHDDEEIERRLVQLTDCSHEDAQRFGQAMAAAVTALPGAGLLLRAVRRGAAARSRTADGARFLGVQQARLGHDASLRAAGVNTVVVRAVWSRFEPLPAVQDDVYIDGIRAVATRWLRAGFRVILDPGLQHTPSWVFSLSNSSCFVDQNGGVRRGRTGEDGADPVWDGEVRRVQLRYLRSLGTALTNVPFQAVQAGGLSGGELSFPDAGPGTNSYWAFSPAAQAASPVPGWRPGDGGITEAEKFLQWYLHSLTEYEITLVGAIQIAFPEAAVHVMYPSWGVRPGQADLAIRARLSGETPAEQNRALQQGLDWANQVPALPAGAVVCTTWLDAPADGNGPVDESPAAFLTRLARPRGVPVAGHCRGRGSSEALRLCLDQVQQLGLAGMVWGTERDLHAADASRAIQTLLTR